jgi:hypothetical protein
MSTEIEVDQFTLAWDSDRGMWLGHDVAEVLTDVQLSALIGGSVRIRIG